MDKQKPRLHVSWKSGKAGFCYQEIHYLLYLTPPPSQPPQAKTFNS